MIAGDGILLFWWSSRKKEEKETLPGGKAKRDNSAQQTLTGARTE